MGFPAATIRFILQTILDSPRLSSLRVLDLSGSYATKEDSLQLYRLSTQLQNRGILVNGLVLWNGCCGESS